MNDRTILSIAERLDPRDPLCREFFALLAAIAYQHHGEYRISERALIAGDFMRPRLRIERDTKGRATVIRLEEDDAPQVQAAG